MANRILNVGCGKETYGTDFIDIYPSRKEVIKCDLQQGRFPFKSGKFDEVYGRSVLEHIKNPGNFIQECARMLKKNGKLVIITDNAAYYRFHLRFFKKDIGVHYERYENGKMILTRSRPKDKHYALFTTLHLRNLLMDSGIHVDEIVYVDDTYKEEEKVRMKFLDFLFSLLGKRIAYRFIKVIGRKI